MKKVNPHAFMSTLCFLISKSFGQNLSYKIHIEVIPIIIIGIFICFHNSHGYNISVMHKTVKITGINIDFKFDNLSKKQYPNINQNIPDKGRIGMRNSSERIVFHKLHICWFFRSHKVI